MDRIANNKVVALKVFTKFYIEQLLILTYYGIQIVRIMLLVYT